MRILGAVLAGGQARRFGSDKAAALLHGTALIDCVIGALAPQVDVIAICGRSYRDFTTIADFPGAGLGPLGGLCGALRDAAHARFDAVLCAPCDTPALPDDLRVRLDPGPSCIADQPVIGLWPTMFAASLEAHIAGGGRSLRSWARASGARTVALAVPLVNVNTPEDLARL